MTHSLLAGLLLATTTLLCPRVALACDDATLASALDAAYPRSSVQDDGLQLRLHDRSRVIDLAQVQCKPWPARPELTLLAVTLLEPSAAVEEVEQGQPVGVADLEVLVVDSATLTVRHRHRENGVLTSDAIGVTGLNLDTALYRLGPKVLAFGVRIARTGASRANPFSIESLRLYAVREGALQPVLRNLAVGRASGEWDTRCVGRWRDITRTVAIGEPGPSGWADLLVSGQVVDSVTAEKGGECDESEHHESQQQVRLRHDGTGYPVPEDWRGFDDHYL